MKKILFDLAATQPNSNGKRHGGGIYGEVVFGRIVERGLPVEVFYDSSRWLNPEIEKLVHKYNINLYDINRIDLQSIIDTHEIDVLYTPLQEDYIKEIENCKIKATIHGLRYLEVPLDWARFNYRNERTLKKFVVFLLHKLFFYWYKQRDVRNMSWKLNSQYDIITVSNHSAYSIKTFFPDFRHKEIKVFYSPLIYQDADFIENSREKYFLLVSANRWEKNNLRAIKALDRLFSDGLLLEYKVYITGAVSADIYTYKIRNKERFVFQGYISDIELTELYKSSYCLIYPSLNEGFGYPPLESMRFGKPVLASSFSSISEVCGDAVIYFNPFSVDEIMNRILMITDDNIYQEMSKRSYKRFEFIKNKQIKDLDRLVDYIYTQK